MLVWTKKLGKLFTSKYVGTGPSSYEKKNLPGRGLTKIEKRCASGYEMELLFHLVPASKQSAVSVWHMPVAICTVQSWTADDGRKDHPKHVLASSSSICLTYACCCMYCTVLNCWWWTERPSETCRLLFPLASRQQYLFDICLLLYVQSWTLDDGRKDRPKHVECYSNKINLRHWCIWLVLL